MKNNKKTIAAAVLAAVIGLTGCNADNKPQTPYSYNIMDAPVVSSVTDTTEAPKPETPSAEASIPETSSTESDKPESESSVSVPSVSSSSTTSTTTSSSSSQSESRHTPVVGQPYQCDPEVGWGHTYEDVISPEPTKTQPGEVKSVCKICGRVFDRVKYANYFNEIIYKYKEDAEADLAAYNLVEELGLNKGDKSDLEKLCILKKWFCANTKYAQPNYTAYSMLIMHEGVCMAYGEALCLLLPKCGIETIYCAGENHAWNAVKIDGQWTYTDFTGGKDRNSETVILGSSSHGIPSFVSYQTFDASSGQRLQDFDFDASVISTKLRLFDLNGKELEVHEEADGFSYVDSNGNGHKVTF